MDALSTESVISRSDKLATGDVNGEVVALDIENGECFGFNAVASRIWTLIAAPTSIRDVCAALVLAYDVDQATCEREVLALIEDFLGAGLITVQASAPP